ncbi:TerD family protein, partial [Gordonia paraffinivorans]|uniref:TerD family protein n=1 Tax=Gordonia paraffinivorans TaxID=175628 RepID=UPI002431BBF6
MGVSLSKGGNVSLTKEAPGLTAIAVGLGWDVRTTTGADFDLDGQVQGRGVTRSPRDSSSG